MRSVKVELLRFGTDTGVFQDRYLVATDGAPARKVEPAEQLGIRHQDVLEALDELRYGKGIDAQQKQEALTKLTALVGLFLGDLSCAGGHVQIDIVTDNVELWALPFELAQDKNGRYLLGDAQREIVLTRRVRRQSFAETALVWPERPRVLFVWAGVPANDHRDALHKALEPWIGPFDDDLIPDPRPAMTELGKANLADIKAACQAAANEHRPYTHVHILAHGALLPGPSPQLAPFGVALRDETVGGDALADALLAGQPGRPTVVTLATCDSANAANTILAGGQVAYELHKRGVPVVVGSQFPLTEQGALVYARRFYRSLLAEAKDVREALREARVALRTGVQEGHDWISVTAHLQLPEGYGQYVRRGALRIELAQLNTASKWAQRIVEDNVGVSAKEAKRIEQLLTSRIESLRSRLDAARESEAAEPLVLENMGLLGSAHKRLAELVFRSGAEDAEQRSREILEEAAHWYYRAHDRALSHHWTGTQHLAIRAATTGQISADFFVHWLAALYAAQRETSLDPDRDEDTYLQVIWALGSVAELWLLAPLTPKAAADAGEQAAAAVRRLVELGRGKPSGRQAIRSTWLQFRRYVTWWTVAHGFFQQRERDLSQDASGLVAILEPHVPQ